MGLYALGKANAIDAIKSAVNARVTNLDDGSKSLDWMSLQKWLAEQGAEIVANDVSTEDRDAARGVLSSIGTDKDSQQLAFHISRQNWETRSDWPSPLSVSSGQAFVSSLASKKDEMNVKADTIEDYYHKDTQAKVEKLLDDFCYEKNIESRMPAAEASIIDTRFYIYTYVNDWGEESAPSPVSQKVEADQNDTVTVTREESAPTGRNIVGWRLYRSNVGTQSAAFQLIAPPTPGAGQVWEDGVFQYFELSKMSDIDELLSSQLGEVCPTAAWLEPPSNLRGLIGMPNGIMAGFFDNTVAFCESFYPYAWPVEHQITTEYPIVALGVFGQVLVVTHQGGVDYISGADSSSMSMQKDVSKQACASARSVVGVEGGVVFASPDGLCLATGNGVQLVTANHFTREDWQKLNPPSMVGAYHELTYYFLWSNGPQSGCYALHLETGKLTTLAVTGSAFYNDALTDRLYVAQGTNIVAMFAGNTYRTGTWRSKIAVLEKQSGFAWLTVESDFAHGPVTVKWYGDGLLRYTATVASREPVRLPAGRYLEHEVEISSQSRWNSLTLASSGDELRGV